MNDEHEPDAERDPQMDDQVDDQVDPVDEARIRALLADLGSAPDATSLPPEVAARLDDTLAGLVAERAGSAPEATDAAEAPHATGTNVIPLRRRWARRTAAAAAVVIVAGAGGVAAASFGLLGGGGSSDSTTAGSASRAESLDESTGSPTTPGAAPGRELLDSTLKGVPAIRAASLEADVALLLQRVPSLGAPAESSGDTASGDAGRREAGKKDADATDDLMRRSCPGPSKPDDAGRTPVTYDGTLAILLVRLAGPGDEGERLVEVWTCAGDRRLARATVPASGLASPSPSP